MKPLALIAAAAAAWWLYSRQAAASGRPRLPAVSTVVTIGGRAYRVVGEPTADGLVPVEYMSQVPGVTVRVVDYYDPVAGEIVRGA